MQRSENVGGAGGAQAVGGAWGFLSSPLKKCVGQAFEPANHSCRQQKDRLESRSHICFAFFNGLLGNERRQLATHKV